MTNMQSFFFSIFLLLALMVIIAVGILSDKEEVVLPPRMISCSFVEHIFIEAARGHKWPSGSVSGCRCLLEYDGKVYIDLMNRDRDFCSSAE